MTEITKRTIDRIRKKSTSREAFISAIGDEVRSMERCSESELRERLAGVAAALKQHEEYRKEIARVQRMLNPPSLNQSAKE